MNPIILDINIHDNVADWSPLTECANTAAQVIQTFSSYCERDNTTSCLDTLQKRSLASWQECLAVSHITGESPEHVLAANAYYESASLPCGCTALAVDSDNGPIHAHCLDWDYGIDLLQKSVVFFHFRDSASQVISVGWPGFLGVFTGMAPGRFAVSLNAVWSEDPRRFEVPIGFILRNLFFTAKTFEEVVSYLEKVQLGCDCVLLVTGSKPNELAVVERTPNRSKIRRGHHGLVLATNHYCSLSAGSNRPEYVETGMEPFGQDSRPRYANALESANEHRPVSVSECMDLVSQPPFRHALSIHQVVMHVSTGEMQICPCPGKILSDDVHRECKEWTL